MKKQRTEQSTISAHNSISSTLCEAFAPLMLNTKNPSLNHSDIHSCAPSQKPKWLLIKFTDRLALDVEKNMAEIRLTRVEQGQTKIRNVPIAVTPEGFWCCPTPAGFQKTLRGAQNPLNKPKSSPSPPPPPPAAAAKTAAVVHKKQSLPQQPEKKHCPTGISRPANNVSDDSVSFIIEAPGINEPTVVPVTERVARPKFENIPRKVAIEFGESGTSDLKVILIGKQGFCVKLSVHKNVLMEKSSFFANKLSELQFGLSCLEIDECEDVEIYVETVGLMYCTELKQRLIKQSVPRVLRILKVAELFGFNSCIQSCLAYLEAVPWVGEEEEEKVVTSVLSLQGEGFRVTPVLKRVSSGVGNQDTLSHIVELVLKSTEDKGRREMKSVVLKLLKENSSLPSNARSTDICSETIYSSCIGCLTSLLFAFRLSTESDFADKPTGDKDLILKQIALEADNLSWLLEILADRQAADEFAQIWANQQEMAALHAKIPIGTRHHVSCITARLFVGIGRGELLPSKDTRQLLLQIWFEPLINDYKWLQHGCRSFDRKVVEEGIGRTILTLPLEDQQGILLAWLGTFLKVGDNCPNLQRAFEVWWRRTFIRPYVESQGNHVQPDCLSYEEIKDRY